MSRRSNGLPGQDWEALTVLAPPAADQVLDALRDEGIAAYATPRGRGGSSLLSQGNEAMSVPLDQVFVNADDVERARTVLDALLPQLEGDADTDPAGDAPDDAPQAAAGDEPASSRPSEDEIWAGIVAAYGSPAAEPDRAVAAGPPDAPPAEARPPADDTGPLTPHRAATGFEDVAEAVAAERRAREEVDEAQPPMRDEHDHYVPPPPPPIPAGDSVTRLAWIGVLGGPLWLVLATILGWGPGGLPGLVAVLAFVGGFITLITRLDHDRPDDGDDGAVV